MQEWIARIIILAFLAFLVWWNFGRRGANRRAADQPVPAPAAASEQPTGQVDASQVGVLTGLLGGSIADAAQAQYALRRVQESTGQTPDSYQVGVAVGMVISQHPSKPGNGQ